MSTIYIIHGTMGNPKENWFPWLKEELEKLGHKVIASKFPTPKNQSLESWMNVFKEYSIDENTILVGHSLAPAFILNILENQGPIKAAFLIAGFTGLLNLPEFDELNKTFTNKQFSWEKIKKNCKKFYIINSDNDPYVPLEKGKELAKNLNTDLIIENNAGHINAEAGYTKFEKLLELIKKEL